jgi:hypothetical protein
MVPCPVPDVHGLPEVQGEEPPRTSQPRKEVKKKRLRTL